MALEKSWWGGSGLQDAQQPLVWRRSGGDAAPALAGRFGRAAAAAYGGVAHPTTLAMAFFSIALTLNLTGVRLNQLKLSDLSPSTLATSVSHQYFTTSAHLTRYYLNLRIVYELESRVTRCCRRATALRRRSQRPSSNHSAATAAEATAEVQANRAARRTRRAAGPQQGQRGEEPPVPMLAKLEQHSQMQSEWEPAP